MSNSTPIVSIIIPIYNCEKYLAKTLDSVLSQSYQELEILCVLDCPTDGSEKITLDYQQQDARIKILRQDNQGVSVARNNGMDKAKGEYLFFLDSDDWLMPNAIELLVNTALKTSHLVISGGIINVDEKTHAQTIYNTKRKTGLIKLKGSCFFDLEIVVWNKLYHHSTLNGIRFEPNLLHEDEDFYWKFFAKNDTAYAISDNIIYYFRRENSITTTKRRDKHYQLNYLNVINNAYNIVVQRPDLKYHFRKRALKYLKKIKSKGAPYEYYQDQIAERYGLKNNFFTKLKTGFTKITS